MTRRLGLAAPREYLAPGQEWPYGDLLPDAPFEVHLAEAVSRNFRRMLNVRNLTLLKASERLDMSIHTLHALLQGKTWTNIAIIARIEQRFNVELWAGAHRMAGGVDYRRTNP